MPKSVARQVEFWIDEYAPGADIKFIHLALTAEQVEELEIPRKSTDVPRATAKKAKASGTFVDRRGPGWAELDALEATHEGELERIVREAVEPYLDDDIEDALAQADVHADRTVAEAWDDHIADEKVALEEAVSAIDEVLASFVTEVEELNGRIAEATAEHREALDQAWSAVEAKAESFEPDLEDRPVATFDDSADPDPLYDSRRNWLAQLLAYKRHAGAADAGRLARAIAAYADAS